jgi:acyl-CoA synthetase (AMP-forming)/AMP-acid ligase II
VSTTFWGRFAARAQASAQSPALFDEHGKTLTFGALRDRCERVAAGLHEQGIGEGSRVTWQLPTRIDTVVLMLALNRLGAVQNPVIPLYGKREVAFVLRQTGAQLLVVPGRWRDTDFGARARELQDEIGPPLQVLLTDDGLPEGDPRSLPAAPETSAMRWVFYTSGTTADPKGVCHTDDSLHAAGHSLVVLHDLRPDDVGSIAFPIAHAGGGQYLASMFEAGFPALLLERLVPTQSVDVMRGLGVTIVGGGSSFYQAVLDEQRRRPDIRVLPTLRKLTGGGTPKPPQLFFDVRRELGAPILHGLGMTESPCITMGAMTDTDEQLAFTEGAAVPGMEVRIMRGDDTPADVGEEGEIQLRGTLMTVGYTDPALNAAAFTSDGWLRGGDLGRLRPDGHLVITGRIKDIIIRKGENVSARELEELLLAHPKVGDVAVIGLPDGDRGERVCAVIESAPTGLPIDLPELQGFLREAGLAVLKLPEQLEVVDALPRNALSKVLKAELRARFS